MSQRVQKIIATGLMVLSGCSVLEGPSLGRQSGERETDAPRRGVSDTCDSFDIGIEGEDCGKKTPFAAADFTTDRLLHDLIESCPTIDRVTVGIRGDQWLMSDVLRLAEETPLMQVETLPALRSSPASAFMAIRLWKDGVVVAEKRSLLAAGRNESVVTLADGRGTTVRESDVEFSQGIINRTGNPLDIAIEGDGFFQLQHPNGEFRYTRAGSFRVDGVSGQLVNVDGLILSPAITVTQGGDISKISICSDGRIQGLLTSSNGVRVDLGAISLVTFLNPAGLSSEGANLFAQTPASGAPVIGNAGEPGFGLIRQGFLETSNVEVVTELISLIFALRDHEINSRAIRADDEMLSTSADIVR